MPDSVFLTALGIDAAFLASGALQLGFSLVTQSKLGSTPTDGKEAVQNLLFEWLPLKMGIVNAAFVFFSFVFTLPGLLLPGRSVLKTSSWMIILCGIVTLCVGVYTWVLTLKIKQTFSPVYLAQTPEVQSLIQKAFNCCGYTNSTSPAFVTDSTCPSPAAAALMPGCAGPISSFGNNAIDIIFTALFGMVGLDSVLVLAIACVLKSRLERERYRIIDQKNGFRPI